MHQSNREAAEMDSEDIANDSGKTEWITPQLTFVGRIRDIVQGGGKSGSNFDADPKNTAKSGVG